MLGGKDISYWRNFLRIRSTRNTKKSELLKALASVGLKEKNKGRFSSASALQNLRSHALLKGKLRIDGEEDGRWAVWDYEQQVVRDPYGYRESFRITSFTTFI
jgi:hypothetical protein